MDVSGRSIGQVPEVSAEGAVCWIGGGGLLSRLPGLSPVPRLWEVFREDCLLTI